MIPESPEVIDQAVKRIKRLVSRVTKNEDQQTADELYKQLLLVTEDYNRAGRVSALFAHRIVRSINARAREEGRDKVDGMDIELDHEPEAFEVAYIKYLNAMIRGNMSDAAEVFTELVANESDEDLQGFILALAKFSVALA